MDSKLHEAVKALVNAVNDFLYANDGFDDDRIIAMGEGVHDVLTAAQKTPALHNWAVECRAESQRAADACWPSLTATEKL